MGEVKLVENSCTTVAVRYRFVFRRYECGTRELDYLPHEVIKCELDLPIDDDEDSKQEEVEIEEVDVKFLRSLDPKEWKRQDHYKVLGLTKARYRASDDHIKSAYRKIVLKHHPDKRKAQGEEIRTDDDYFTCITMAYETLGNTIKRRSYDSVDPEFDNAIPHGNELKQDFFEVFPYYFDLNSRWSEKRKVPKIGNTDSPREHVERFYSFWYDFKSWREYSYEDEEDKEKCQDRDERRYVDKMNKAERLRKKKEEMSRIRQLVDLAYNADPRIAKFKQEDKERKLAMKKAKQTAAQQRKEEEEKILRELQEAKEKADAEEKARLDAKRLEREAQKKILKKERKTFRDTCKANNYFTQNDEEILKHMQAIETICETLSAIELEELNKNLKNNGRQAFTKALNDSQTKIEEEKKSVLETYMQRVPNQLDGNNSNRAPDWTNDNLHLLIKAVNLFPAGTNQRWDVVANFINQHGSFPDNSKKFNAKVVLAKAKDLQNTDFSKNNLKEAANKQAFDNMKKEKRNVVLVDESGISKKIDEEKPIKSKKNKSDNSDAVNGSQNLANGDIKVEKPWTATEQQLLEQALKTYPASSPERWDRIAECVPDRSKKDCMKRYKELVEIVKAKKAAQLAATSK